MVLSSRQKKEFLVKIRNVSRFKKTANNSRKSGKNLSLSLFRIHCKLVQSFQFSIDITRWGVRIIYFFNVLTKIPSPHVRGFLSGEDTIKRLLYFINLLVDYRKANKGPAEFKYYHKRPLRLSKNKVMLVAGGSGMTFFPNNTLIAERK